MMMMIVTSDDEISESILWVKSTSIYKNTFIDGNIISDACLHNMIKMDITLHPVLLH